MEYAAKIILEVNGQQVDDFVSVTVKEIELKREVKLARKVGVVSLVPKHGVQVEYAVPLDAPEFPFEEVSDGTLTIDLENGARTTFSGVYTLKIGDTKYDGEKEATRTIDLLCMRRSA